MNITDLLECLVENSHLYNLFLYLLVYRNTLAVFGIDVSNKVGNKKQAICNEQRIYVLNYVIPLVFCTFVRFPDLEALKSNY